jgi:hypothetical protein
MAKTPIKTLLALVLTFFMAGSDLAAYGIFHVTSNTVHVDLQFTINLFSSIRNDEVALTARVRINGNLVGDGIDIAFYYSHNGGEWTHFTTKTTNRGGIARTTYTIAAIGTYDFRAEVSSI